MENVKVFLHKNMAPHRKKISTWSSGKGPCKKSRFALLLGLAALLLTLALAQPAPASTPSPGKVLEDLHYQVDVWIWRDALRAQVLFREVGPGRYRAEIDGRSQGLLSLISGNWQGKLSTDMEYSQGGLKPLVYREISYKKGKKRVMEYRFNYAAKKVELWKQEGDAAMAKRWETTLTGPMYDPLTFFYNRRLTGKSLGEKGGDNLKFQGIPYPKPDEITLRVGDKTSEGRKIMLELGNRIHKDERSQVYAYLDNEGVPTKAWTQIGKFGNVDITLLPGGKRLNKEEVTKTPAQARDGGN
jgi:Protein of unknown function (DUF3108)